MSFFALLLLLQSAPPSPPAQPAQQESAEPAASAEAEEPGTPRGGLWGPSGAQDGRRGNDLYQQEAYADAAAAYAGGIAILSDDDAPRLRYGLRNNLGAALLKSGDAESARRAFDQAMAEARETGEEMDLARSAYNAGNAAFAAEDLKNALAHYRNSLLRNPDNEDARFNYEFVKRRLEEQEQQQQQNQDPQEDGDEDPNDENEQNESRQDENESESQQNEQSEQQPEQEPERSGENEPQPGESPREQEQETQNPSGEEQPLSQAQAERILQALEQEEGNLLRELQRTAGSPHRVEKDW